MQGREHSTLPQDDARQDVSCERVRFVRPLARIIRESIGDAANSLMAS